MSLGEIKTMSAIDRSKSGFLDVEVATMDEHPDIVKAIFGQCLVLSATPNPLTDSIRYLLICDEFETLGDEEDIPDYSIGVDGESISFERIK
jgi:hypothetical protein